MLMNDNELTPILCYVFLSFDVSHMNDKFQYNKVSFIIKNFFKSDEWDDLSGNDQNYYLTYLSNPNHFFFRSSFLNEEKITGEFSHDEEEFFSKRFSYFRNDLRIQKIPWGYFSIPFRGRAGYQCAWYYRESLLAKKYEPDPNYPFVNNVPKHIFDENPILLRETIRQLEEEAFRYITENKKKVDMKDYSEKPPAYVYQEISTYNQHITSIKIAMKGPQRNQLLANRYAQQNTIDDSSINSNKDKDDMQNATTESRFPANENDYKSNEDTSNAGTTPNEKQAGPISDIEKLLQEDKELPIDPNNPMIDFIDPITHRQIKDPMLSVDGFVMGRKSWEYCLKHKEEAPCNMSITCVDDLIALTKENFDSMKAFITNA